MLVEVIEKLVEDGAGSGDTGDFAHGLAVGVAHPDTDAELWGETEGPVVPVIGTGAGLTRHREIEVQMGVEAESGGSCGIVGEDICGEVGGFRREDLARGE